MVSYLLLCHAFTQDNTNEWIYNLGAHQRKSQLHLHTPCTTALILIWIIFMYDCTAPLALSRLRTKTETDFCIFFTISLAGAVIIRQGGNKEQLLCWLHPNAPHQLQHQSTSRTQTSKSYKCSPSPSCSLSLSPTHLYKEYQWAYCFHFKGKQQA